MGLHEEELLGAENAPPPCQVSDSDIIELRRSNIRHILRQGNNDSDQVIS